MEKLMIPDFCIVRTHAYPANLLYNFYQGKPDDPDTLNRRLKDIFSDASVQTALHSSSSPEFFSEFQKWLRGLKTSRENERLHDTLIKYLNRMTSRCVPFGLFSGFAVTPLGNRTDFELNTLDKGIAHLRVDMEYMQTIFDVLNADERIRNSVRFFKNSTIYPVYDQFKYIEYVMNISRRQYSFAAVSTVEYLELILQATETGKTILEMIGLLQEYDPEIEEQEAREYINELISSQVIVSELEPNITGEDILNSLIKRLDQLDGKEKYIDSLKEIQLLVADKIYREEKSDRIRDIIEDVIGTKTTWSILQVDLELPPKKNLLGKNIFDTLCQQIKEISMLSFGINRTALREFKKDFLNRYDTAEVPMVEALDPEIGVGYGNLGNNPDNRLLNNVFFDNNLTYEPVQTAHDSISDFVNDKFAEGLKNQSQIVIVNEAEIDRLKALGMDRELPDSFFVHGCLISESQEEIDNGNFRFQLKNLSGPPSCLTIGRFCHTSELLAEKVRECIQVEEDQNKEAIYAEIVHLTDARIGNVTIRPRLRNYEIQYLGKSGLELEQQIPISDIMISMKEDKIVLRSKKLNKQIIPRLTNAHTFAVSNLPVYKFFGELQREKGNDWLSWHWHNLQKQKFLPRVEYKNIILKPARWLFSKSDLIQNGSSINETEAITIFKRLAADLSLPRFLLFTEEEDKEFIVDMETDLSIRFLIKYLMKYGRVTVEEYLRHEKNCWIKDVNGSFYSNEVMIPVSKVKENGFQESKMPDITIVPSKISIERKFSLGSEWVYFKLYSGKQTLENILASHIYDYVQDLMRNNQIVTWHFIRYNDPYYHVRLRFQTPKNSNCYLDVIKKGEEIFRSLIEKKFVHRIQADTYDREIERYGLHTMELTEKLFSIDSTACIGFIKLSENYEELNERWLWTIKAVDMTLDAFGYLLEGRHKLMVHFGKHQLKRVSGNKDSLKQINTKYKGHEKEIKNFLSPDCNIDQLTDFLKEAEYLLAERNKQLAIIVPDILQYIRTYNEVKLNAVVGSYTHMFINRIFIADPNKCEAIIYNMLERYYLAKIKTKVL